MPEVSADQLALTEQRAVRLRGLREHPGWAELESVIAERKEFHYRKLHRALIEGEVVDQRLIDRMAGYFDACEDLLKRPDMANRAFASALARYQKAELAKEGVSS